MKKKLVFAFCFTLALIFAFSSCSGGTDSYQTVRQSQTVSKEAENDGKTVQATKLDFELPVRVKKGGEGVAILSFEPADADVEVYCDSDAIELIETPQKNDSGEWAVFFKAKKNGAFKITASSGSLSVSKSSEVYTELEGISISPEQPNALEVNEKIHLSANLSPSGANEKIVWASSDESVATVDQNGVVTAKKSGKTFITAYATFYESSSVYDGETTLATFVEVTVKGLFLNESEFFLSSKATTNTVNATILGLAEGNVTWTSSNESIFTVTPDASDSSKARLSYVLGASGDATLTASLNGNTATATVHVAKWSIVALGDSISAGYAPKAFNTDDKSLEEPAMLSAYEDYLNRRKNPSINPNYVNKYCYTNVLYEKLSENANFSVNSYAKTGDRTEHLIEKLKSDFVDPAAGIKKGEILDAVNNADYITLCIGANDFLKNATADFLIKAGEGNDNEFFRTEYPAELERCFAGFKTNFDSIIETLTQNGQKVFVMSVYSPYNYFTLDNIPESERTAWIPAGWRKYVYTKGFLRLNEETCKYLLKVNDYIKNIATNNSAVYFVDVANNFSGTNAISKNDYPKYIHADPSKFSLATIGVATLSGTVPIWIDPHPTIKGEAKIADLFKEVFDAAN